MKLTTAQLRQIIREEVQRTIDQGEAATKIKKKYPALIAVAEAHATKWRGHFGPGEPDEDPSSAARDAAEYFLTSRRMEDLVNDVDPRDEEDLVKFVSDMIEKEMKTSG